MKHMFYVVEFQSVPGIGTPLESSHDIIFGRENIYNLTFPFVAPLQTEQYINFCHLSYPLKSFDGTLRPSQKRGKLQKKIVTGVNTSHYFSFQRRIAHIGPWSSPSVCTPLRELFGFCYPKIQ